MRAIARKLFSRTGTKTAATPRSSNVTPPGSKERTPDGHPAANITYHTTAKDRG